MSPRIRTCGWSSSRRLVKLQLHLVHKAPSPRFSRLQRAHDGVSTGMKVLGGVFVLGGIAAADMAALQAQSQVNPRVAGFQTLFAATGVWLHFFDLVQMCAAGHGVSF